MLSLSLILTDEVLSRTIKRTCRSHLDYVLWRPREMRKSLALDFVHCYTQTGDYLGTNEISIVLLPFRSITIVL
jgi:hypothetical protein